MIPRTCKQLYEKLSDATKREGHKACNEAQREACPALGKCGCIYVDSLLVSFWKFRRIAIVVGKYGENEKWIVFDGTESQNCLDWFKVEVSEGLHRLFVQQMN